MNVLTFLALVTPGFIVAYVLFIQPMAKEQFKEYFADADTRWQKVWAFAGNSLTIAIQYVVAAVGWLLSWIDPIATAFGDPDLRQNVSDALSADPKVLGYVLMGISALTLYARFRKMGQGE